MTIATSTHHRSTAGTGTPAPASRLWTTGLLASLVASAATTSVAVIARAADVALAVDGESIPIGGFAMMTALWSVVGIGIAAATRRWSRYPRRTFVATAVMLTAVSCVPSLTVDADTATNLVLAGTHVVAAAIVVPVLASGLRPTSSRAEGR